MWKAEVEIEGIVPIKFNRITARTMREISGEGGKKATPEELAEEWEEKCYKNEKGYFIPISMFKQCLIKGMCSPVPVKCNKVKFNRDKARGTFFIENDGYLQNGGSKLEPKKDVNAILTNYGLTLTTRPRFKEGWNTKFIIFVAFDWVTLTALKDGLIQAGQCHGVGSNRPDFGRFIVKDVKLIK